MASVSFYFDEHLPRSAAEQLVKKGYSVVISHDVGMTQKDDIAEHLQYATEHHLIVVTFDRGFAGLAAKRTDHHGLVCLSGMQNDVGYIVRTLIEFAELYDAEKDAGQVFWF
jgi:predicted nuclease of predicted toxin-antitoxin system